MGAEELVEMTMRVERLTFSCTRLFLVVPPNLPDEVVEGFIHVNPLFGRGLDVATTKTFREISSLC